MKRGILKIIAMLTVLLVLAGCSVREVEVEPTMTPTATTTPAPEAEPALAICMNTLDHPVHRQVQLGFLDGCKELGYEDVSIIGAVDGDQKSQLDMALEWAKSVEGRPAAMLLWNGDHNSDELCEKLDKMGVYVGIPHFAVFVEDDYDAMDDYWRNGDINALDRVRLPKGVDFELKMDDCRAGKYAAEFIAKKLDGKKGSIISLVNAKGGADNYHEWEFSDTFDELKAQGEYDLSQVKMLDSVLSGGEYEACKTITLGILQENRDILGIFCTTSYLAKACVEARELYGKSADDIVIMGYQITEENVELFENGKVALVVDNSIYREAYKCAENFDKLFKGEKVPKFEFLEAEYLTEETADELLPRYKELFERTKDDEFFERYKAKKFIVE